MMMCCKLLLYSNIRMSLRVRLLSAQLSHDTELLSNMDPYCYLQLGSQRYRSKTKNQAGKKPVWNETFQFTSTDSILKVTVMDQDTFSDDLVGEGTINVDYLRNSPTEQQSVVQLYYKGKTAGKVILSVSGNGGQNVWGNNSTNTWGNNSTNKWGQNTNYSQAYNQPNLSQSYNKPNYNQGYNQPYSQPNQWQAGNQFGNNQNWGSQGNMAPTNSPWGDLSQNNGWGNFNPSSPGGSNPNIPPNNQNVNPLTMIGGIFGNVGNNQYPPNQQGNPYGNPYK